MKIQRKIGSETRLVEVEQEVSIYEEVEIVFPFYRKWRDDSAFTCVFLRGSEVCERRCVMNEDDSYWQFVDFPYALHDYHLAHLYLCTNGDWKESTKEQFLNAAGLVLQEANERYQNLLAITNS